MKPEHVAYINKFSETRRYKRVAAIAEKWDDPIRVAVGLPIGEDAGFYVGADRFEQIGRTRDPENGIVDYNTPPSGQPGLWCQWVATDDGDIIEWDGGEKFYNYVEWLEYLIEKFLKPWGYTVNGEVLWYGEDREDVGKIVVKENDVQSLAGTIVYGNE